MGLKNCFCLILISLTRSRTESSEEIHQFAYNQAYAPPSMAFRDIYVPGRPQFLHDLTSTTADEEFHTSTLTTQSVGFDPQVLKIQPITTPTDIQNTSYVNTTEVARTTSTTYEPQVMPTKIVPLKHYQRGVLDLLLPPPRVRTFKNVFDTIRRMLSYTFKKR